MLLHADVKHPLCHDLSHVRLDLILDGTHGEERFNRDYSLRYCITVRLTSCCFSCLDAYVELATYLLAWSIPNLSKMSCYTFA